MNTLYSIKESAPVKGSALLLIEAPWKKVWDLLTDINAWPDWNAAVTKVRFHGDLSEGASFEWTSSGMKILSEIRQIDRDRGFFAWAGRIWWVQGIHNWRVEQIGSDQTRVTSQESLEGLLIGAIYSDEKLREELERWLRALKSAAE